MSDNGHDTQDRDEVREARDAAGESASRRGGMGSMGMPAESSNDSVGLAVPGSTGIAHGDEGLSERVSE